MGKKEVSNWLEAVENLEQEQEKLSKKLQEARTKAAGEVEEKADKLVEQLMALVVINANAVSRSLAPLLKVLPLASRATKSGYGSGAVGPDQLQAVKTALASKVTIGQIAKITGLELPAIRNALKAINPKSEGERRSKRYFL